MKSFNESNNENDYFKRDGLKRLEVNNSDLKIGNSKSKHRKSNSGSAFGKVVNTQSEKNLLL